MPKVFISHATVDRAVVTRDVIDLLRDHGIEVWFAEDDIATARQWERSILEGLQACDWFLVALTPGSVKSEWVKDETHWAIEERPGRIVPVLMEDCDVRGIHIRLPRIQYVDFRKVNDEARRRLLACWDVEYRPAARLHVRFAKLGERYSICEPLSARDSPREYLAKDAILNRDVLIKCDRSNLNDPSRADGNGNPIAIEAHALASLIHPAIPRVFDLAHDSELGTYSVLEHIPGTSLREQLKAEKSWQAPDVVKLMVPLCNAVHYANEQGIIHRNIKPASITINDKGRPFLTNFIIAKNRDREESGILVGTPRYLAPEQMVGGNIDCRVDVYGLGVLLYELLTGKLPFGLGNIEQNWLDLLRSIVDNSLTPLRQHDPGVPKWIEAICLKCLEVNPNDRYSTVAELESALLACHPRKGKFWPW
jgi:hypothetical protein